MKNAVMGVVAFTVTGLLELTPIGSSAAGAAPYATTAVLDYYIPGTIEIQQGDRITLINADIGTELKSWKGHTITEVGPDVRFDSGFVALGATGEVHGVPQLTPGRYGFFCRVYPFMRGTLIVHGRTALEGPS
jgi:plastocyanin